MSPFWLETSDGTLYDGLAPQKIQGLDANGDCICDDGYAGGVAGTCEKIPGYDFENTESVVTAMAKLLLRTSKKLVLSTLYLIN